jgi:putative redox protein
MTPIDLLVASLSSCIAFYAGQYLDRHGMNRDGLKVTADFTLDTDRPARTGEVTLKIRVPGGVPGAAILRARGPGRRWQLRSDW